MEASLRFSQCLREEGLAKVAAALKSLPANQSPTSNPTIAGRMAEGRRDLASAAKFLDEQIRSLEQKQAAPEIRGRMLYEAAWCYRDLAEQEVADARGRMQQDLLEKKKAAAAKKKPSQAVSNSVTLPDIPLSSIPLQPSEKAARAQYQALLAAFPDISLAINARFELAELLSARQEQDAALKLLADALDKEPPADLARRDAGTLEEVPPAHGRLPCGQEERQGRAGSV